jgi:hypothetical protein
MEARTRFFPLIFAVALLSNSCDLHKLTGVQWKDIASWKSLGTRWASAYDSTGKRIAIFDLSYPGIAQEIELGLLGEQQIPVKTAIQEIRQALSERSPGEIASHAAQVTTLQNYLKSLDGQNGSFDQLPDRWWEKLPWTPEAASRIASSGDQGPDSFTLADFDLDSVATDKKKLHSILARLENAQETPDSAPILGKNFLSGFRFARTDKGGYRMTYTPQAPDPGLLARPKKFVDFTLELSGAIENGVWEGVKSGIGDLVGLIPIPILKALVDTAIGRFFHAHDLMNGMHLAMLNEVTRFADEMPSSLSELSPTELTAAQGWLVLTAEDLWKVPIDLLRKPEKVWKEQVDGDQKRSAKAHTWLEKHGFGPTAVTSRFDEGFRDSKHYLFTLPVQAHWISDAPIVALRYDQVEETEKHREFIEVLSAAVSFATHFVPIVGGTIDDIYGWLVSDPIDRDKTWESRLKITLLENPMQIDRDWSPELADLDQMKVDILELSVADAQALVDLRKKQLGITPN